MASLDLGITSVCLKLAAVSKSFPGMNGHVLAVPLQSRNFAEAFHGPGFLFK